MPVVSGNTERQYAAIYEHFESWRQRHRYKHPMRMLIVADYLNECLTEFGPSSVIQRVSAIAKLYRDEGYPFDTKTTVIQTILKQARELQRAARKK